MTPEERLRIDAIYHKSELLYRSEITYIEYSDFVIAQIREAVSEAQMEWEGTRGPQLLLSGFEKGRASMREEAVKMVKRWPKTIWGLEELIERIRTIPGGK